MAAVPLIFKNFDGGWATDLKVGMKNSFAYSQSIDFRKSPSQLTILPAPAREDTNVVNDLIQNEVMTADGTIYAIGSNGTFYKRTTAGAWSVEAKTGTGTYGIDYRKDTDHIYVSGTKHVHRLEKVSTSPVFDPQYYGPSFSTYDNSVTMGFNVAAYQAGSAQTTTLNTSIIEQQTNLRYFQSDIEPLNKISVFVKAKGTGDWTLTLHDGLNNVLATSTVTNANLINGTFNDFVFNNATNGQVRIYIAPNARTYHFHLTSTVADGTVSSSSVNNLSSCDCEVWADRLVVTQNGMHPIQRFLQYETFGNGNYLSIWEPISDPPTNSEWQRHKLVFPQEYEVCGLAAMNEYLAIACEKNTSLNTSIPQEGIIFFWDGLSDTYNYYVRIPEGSPYGLHEYKNVVYYYAGGDWYGIASASTVPVKIRSMPNSDATYTGTNSYVKVYPYAATVRKGIHLMAYPSETNNTSINFGVYSYGQVDKNFPNSFGYNYIPSTGSQNYSSQNNLRLGMVKSFGDTLHISWRDDVNGGYGIDVVDSTSTPAQSASWQSLIFDNGMPSKIKKALYMKVSFAALPAGATVQPTYSINRGAWQTDTTFSSTVLYKGRTDYCRIEIPEGDFTEIQLGVNLTATNTTPTITSVMLAFDDNRDELLT